jgi:hypothetical protein
MAYGKSFVCAVDNGRALMNQMLDKEKSHWRCVWQETPNMSWEHYGDTFQAGVRRLLFRMETPTHKKTLHNFKYVHSAKPSALKHGLKEAAGTSSSSSSSKASGQAGSAARSARSKSSSSKAVASPKAVQREAVAVA